MPQPTRTTLTIADTDCTLIVPKSSSRRFIHLENLGTTTVRFGYSKTAAADMRTDGHKLLAGDSLVLAAATAELPEEVWAAAETAGVDLTASYN